LISHGPIIPYISLYNSLASISPFYPFFLHFTRKPEEPKFSGPPLSLQIKRRKIRRNQFMPKGFHLSRILKNGIASGVVVSILGLLIAFGPRFLFKVCNADENGFPHCHWSAQAEIGIGIMIAALGLGLMLFSAPHTHLGLYIGIFFSSAIALCVPHALIGGCNMMSMACRRVAFPAITVISIVLLLYSAINVASLVKAKEARIG
jgi:hypothetical protein